MAEKMDLIDKIENELANSGLTNEELERNIPLVYSLMTSAKDKSMRQNALISMLANKAFQKELRGFDEFKEFDFSKYDENADKIKKLPKNLEEADIKDVEAFYNKAKAAIDPHGRLGDTELYDTAGPATFEQLEEKFGDDYTGDWFGNLLEALDYPTDTPEAEYKSMDQLAKDFQTALTRMKNHNVADKFGKAKTPLKFVFGRSFDVLEDGKKPTIFDVGTDAVTNALWALPFANWFRAGKAVPVVQKALKNIGLAAIAPVTSEALDTIVGTDTEEEKRKGLKGRVEDAGINTAVNMATPGLAKRVPSMAIGIADHLGLKPKEINQASKWLSDKIDFGNSQEAAKAALLGIAEAKDEAAQVISRFAQRIGKQRGAISDWTLDNIRKNLPGYLQESGGVLAQMIKDNGRSFKKGKDAFMKSIKNPDEGLWQQIADAPKTLYERMSPYLWTYGINRLGTQGVGGWIRRRFGRTTRPWETETEEK